MIKLQCDLCGSDSKRVGYNLIVSDLDCQYKTNTTLECGTKTFLLCPACYNKLNLPNIYAKDKKTTESAN